MSQVIKAYKDYLTFFNTEYLAWRANSDIGISSQLLMAKPFMQIVLSTIHYDTDMTPKEIHELGLARGGAYSQPKWKRSSREVGFEGLVCRIYPLFTY